MKPPFTLKLDQPEAFVVRILRTEGVIRKARFLHEVLSNEEDYERLEEPCVKWSQLASALQKQYLFQAIVRTCFEIALLMQPRGPKT